jgi:hypothetical protein
VYWLVIEVVVLQELGDYVRVCFALKAPLEQRTLLCDQPPPRLLTATVGQSQYVMRQHVSLHITPQLVLLQHKTQIILITAATTTTNTTTSSSSCSSLPDAPSRSDVVDVFQHLKAIECRLLELR